MAAYSFDGYSMIPGIEKRGKTFASIKSKIHRFIESRPDIQDALGVWKSDSGYKDIQAYLNGRGPLSSQKQNIAHTVSRLKATFAELFSTGLFLDTPLRVYRNMTRPLDLKYRGFTATTYEPSQTEAYGSYAYTYLLEPGVVWIPLTDESEILLNVDIKISESNGVVKVRGPWDSWESSSEDEDKELRSEITDENDE
jgi:hypothetical protein